MEKHALYKMTWKEVEEAFAKDPVVLIPMGSTEQQGIHSLTGDYLAAEEIAKRTAEASGAYYIPVIPFGCSEYFRCFPGTISLRPSTVEAVITDVVQSLTEHGVTKIFFINGHAGNTPTIEDVVRKLRREKGLTCVSIDLWQGLTDQAKKEIYGEHDSSGHGGDPLTSVMMYLFPDSMRMDLLGPVENIKEYKGVPVTALKKGMVAGVPFNVYMDMSDMTKQGVMGDPFASSAERGKKIVDHLVHACCEMVDILKTHDMHL